MQLSQSLQDVDFLIQKLKAKNVKVILDSQLDDYGSPIKQSMLVSSHGKSSIKMTKKPKDPNYKNRFCPPEFSRLLHRTKELRDFSVMSISEIWDKCVLHEFFDEFETGNSPRIKTENQLVEIKEDDEDSEENIHISPKKHQDEDTYSPKKLKISEIVDKTDFFLILDGSCYLSFDVKITLDQSDALKKIQNKLNSLEDSFNHTEEQINDIFQVRFQIPQFAVIDENNIKKYQVDFVKYFQELGKTPKKTPKVIQKIPSHLTVTTPIDQIQQKLNQTPKPVVENFPNLSHNKIIRYDIIHNSGVLHGGLGTSTIIQVPFREYQDIKNSFWRDDARFTKFIAENLPGIQNLLVSQQNKILQIFKEVKFNPGCKILSEGTALNKKFYLIASGEVKLECYKNPFRKMALNKQDLLKNLEKPHQIYDNCGSGNVSETIRKNNLGSVFKGTWIGDENCLLNGELPQIYSAFSLGEVRAFQVDLEDFNLIIPAEIIQKMTDRAYTKLFALREKLHHENQKKLQIENMDHNTQYLAKTVNHMQTIFPSSTLIYQKRANKLFNEKAKNNPFKIISLADGRRESHNKDTNSFKSEIHKSQRQIFAEYDRIKNIVQESKTYHVKSRTLFSLDYQNVQTQREIENNRNLSKKTLDMNVNLNESFERAQGSTSNLLKDTSTIVLPAISGNRSKSVARETISKVSKSPNGKLMKFTTRFAHDAFREQAQIEYKRGKNQSITHGSSLIPVTNEVAFYQSLIEMQDWKRKMHVANTLQYS